MKLWKVYYELERQNIIKSIDLAKKRWRRFAETGYCDNVSCFRCPFLKQGDGRRCCAISELSLEERKAKLNEEVKDERNIV